MGSSGYAVAEEPRELMLRAPVSSAKPKPCRVRDGAFGKRIVFTGTLSVVRRVAAAAAKAAGAVVSGSVSSRTDIVVVGPGAGSKLPTADALGVSKWTEEQ